MDETLQQALDDFIAAVNDYLERKRIAKIIRDIVQAFTPPFWSIPTDTQIDEMSDDTLGLWVQMVASTYIML